MTGVQTCALPIFWIMLHGIVSLVNSRVLQEVAGESPSFIEATLKDVADFIVA